MGKKPIGVPGMMMKASKKKKGKLLKGKTASTLVKKDKVPRRARPAAAVRKLKRRQAVDSGDVTAPAAPSVSPAVDCRAAAGACLRWILSPTETGEFFSRYWEQGPLLVKRSIPDYYTSVFSSAELDRILRQENVQFGRNIDVTSFTDGVRETHNPSGRAHAPVVWDYYRNGCSIRLLNPQTYTSTVWRLCATLQEYFGCMVGANVYLTPAGTQGFAPHYDDIEAFMLQLEGKKHWRVYKPRPGEELARFSSGNFSPEEVPESPVIDTVLEAGDLLYMPRGSIHQGRCLPQQHSLHITISCYQRTAWADLLEKMVPVALQRAIEDSAEYRRGLPVGYLSYMGLVHDEVTSQRRSEFLATARRLITQLVDYLPVDAAADQMAVQFIQDALPPALTQDERCRSVHEDGERWGEGRVTGRATMDGDTEIKLIRPNAVRLVNEAGQLRLYYSVENSRVYREQSEQYLELDSDLHAESVASLVHRYPSYIPVQQLPGDDEELKVAFAVSLWEKGLIVTKQPLSEEEDDQEEDQDEAEGS